MKCSINHPPSKTGNSKGNRVCGGVYFPLVLFRVIEIDLDQPLKLMVMIIPKYVIYIFSLKIFIDVMYYVWIFLTLIYARLGIYTERSVLAPDPKHTEDYFHWCSCTSSTALLTLCIYYIYVCVCGALFSWQLRTFSRTHHGIWRSEAAPTTVAVRPMRTPSYCYHLHLLLRLPMLKATTTNTTTTFYM